MTIFLNLYQAIEKAVFNSLTRKLVGNIVFIFGLQLLLYLVIIVNLGNLKALIATADGSMAEQMGAVVSRTSWQATAVLLVACAASIASLLFLIFLVVRPIRKLNLQLQSMSQGDVDLAAELQVDTYDEFRDLASNYNRFLGQLKETVHTLRKMGIEVAVGATTVVSQVKDVAGRASDQGEQSTVVFGNSQVATQTLSTISDNVQHIASSTSDNLDAARGSLSELQTVNQEMETMLARIKKHDATIKTMDDKSRDIRSIITTIQGISFQTGLLSLNAAVEAARAGEAGKGFSVVATEVKKLAEQANNASEQIAGQITDMLSDIDSALAEADVINRAAGQTMQVSQTACDNYAGLIKEFDENHNKLTQISASVEEISSANEVTHEKVTSICELSNMVVESTASSQQVATRLQTTSETMQQLVARFVTGEGAFEQLLKLGRGFRDQATKAMEKLIREGYNLFDTNYREIPNTQPQKYSTGYDQAFTPRLQPLYDETLAKMPQGIFAICVDTNGYGPSHNSVFAQPLSGDPQRDISNSRDKRLFNDPTGLRAARSTESFLLQTYMRDTGEILSDLSLPIHIDGRHWGAIRLGFNPRVLLDQD